MRYLIVLLLILVCVIPASARQWTSRSGDFTIEAELKDVRDGKAILKKPNGEEVAVPLNKLSLGDIEYIKRVLREAEAGVTGKTEPPAPPPAAEPAKPAPNSEEKPAPQNAPGELPTISYKWQKDKLYQYRIKAVARFGDKQDNINGSVFFTVVAIGDNGVVDMTFVETTGRGGRDAIIYAPPRLPRSRYRPSPGRYLPSSPSSPSRLQIDRHGRILRIEGSEYLPFLLGRAAHLPLEPLSPLNENPWTVATDVAISLNHEDWLSNSVFATMRKELLPAREKATYKIVGRDGELITVSKSYELATAAESDGKPRVSLVGEGMLKFDPQAGVFKSSEMKLRAAVRESGTTVEFPVEISYNMPSEAEMAEMNAKLEKARQEAEQRAKERLTPITPDEMEQLIKDLQSSDPAKTQAAVTRLTDKQPQEPNGKLAAALEEMLKSDTPKIRENAARVMEVWAAPENIPSLKKLLDDDSTTIRRSALKALGQLKATEAIDRIIEQWPKDSIPVSAALRAMGEAAEPAVLKLLETSGNNRVRRDACRVLGEIGTEKSLAALEIIEKDSDRSMQFHARMALSNLRRKLGKD